jgi:hypothetical protein
MGTILEERWKTEIIDSLTISRIMTMRKECKEDEKIGFICGIPCVVKMTPLEISLNSFLLKIKGTRGVCDEKKQVAGGGPATVKEGF